MKKILQIVYFLNRGFRLLPNKIKWELSTRMKYDFLIMCCFLGLLGISSQVMAFNRIQLENQLPGSGAWTDFRLLGSAATDNLHNLEGYADRDSVGIGEKIKFYVNANPKRYPKYSITLYRLGWYGGLGGREMAKSVTLPSITQIVPKKTDPVTGLLKANWKASYALTIPKNWISGIYVATLVGSNMKEGQYIPFVVRDANRKSQYLFQSSTTTWHAYNAWGGKSFYGYNSNATPVHGNKGAVQPARKVSFDRPYDVGGGTGALLAWEINMLRFMEKEGYDVTYQSNIDTHRGNGGLLNHKAVLSVGHDEYWTKAMRDNFENARAHGVSLGFFGANAGYWQIRLESNNRTMVGYKDFSMTEDPIALDANLNNNKLVTSRWREGNLNGGPDTLGRVGANRPENALIGVMYAFGPKGSKMLNGNIKSTKSDPKRKKANPHWVYTDSGIVTNSVFPQLLGYEADRVFDNGVSPAGLEIVASSYVPLNMVDHDSPLSAHYDPAKPKSHMTIYSWRCNVLPCQNSVATVFAAGSLQWVWGLDTRFKWPVREPVPVVQKITRNILTRMVNPQAFITPASETLITAMPNSVASLIEQVLDAVVPKASADTL